LLDMIIRIFLKMLVIQYKVVCLAPANTGKVFLVDF
jgi:hypothetical protein